MRFLLLIVFFISVLTVRCLNEVASTTIFSYNPSDSFFPKNTIKVTAINSYQLSFEITVEHPNGDLGWVAFGIPWSTTDLEQGMDCVIGSGTMGLVDAYAHWTCYALNGVCIDADQGGTYDLVNPSVKQSEKSTIITFVRNRVNSDAWDFNFVNPGTPQIYVFAISSTQNIVGPHDWFSTLSGQTFIVPTYVECLSNVDCYDNLNPQCDLTTKTCVACTTNTHCTYHPSGGVCILTGVNKGKCGCSGTTTGCTGRAFGTTCIAAKQKCGCTAVTHCKNVTHPICNVPLNTCGNCLSNINCESNPNGSVCNSAYCGCSIDADCSSSTSGGACINGVCGCKLNTDCSNGVCSCGTKKCIPCFVDIDCNPWERCTDKNVCSPLKCTFDSQCVRDEFAYADPSVRCSDAGICVLRTDCVQ